MKDIMGNEITVGCRVAYATRYGDRAVLVLRTIVKVEDGKAWFQRESRRPGVTKARCPARLNPKNAVVVTTAQGE